MWSINGTCNKVTSRQNVINIEVMSIEHPKKYTDSKAKQKGGKLLYSVKLCKGLYVNSPSAADTIFTSIPLFFAPVYFLCCVLLMYHTYRWVTLMDFITPASTYLTFFYSITTLYRNQWIMFAVIYVLPATQIH